MYFLDLLPLSIDIPILDFRMDLNEDLDRHRSFLNDLKNDLNIFIFYQMIWKMIFGSDQGSLNKSELNRLHDKRTGDRSLAQLWNMLKGTILD